MIKIEQITENKKQYLSLLLLADEQEDMLDRYLGRGEMFALFEDALQCGEPAGPVTVCVVTEEAPDTCELKNIATAPEAQRKGYGRRMLEYLFTRYQGKYKTMLVGTGDTPGSLGFYQSCGFVPSHRIPHFFLEHYDHPIIEDGILLNDMVYLKKEL